MIYPIRTAIFAIISGLAVLASIGVSAYASEAERDPLVLLSEINQLLATPQFIPCVLGVTSFDNYTVIGRVPVDRKFNIEVQAGNSGENEWTPERMKVLHDYLQGIEIALPHFISKIVQEGYKFRLIAPTDSALAETDTINKVIYLTPRFFELDDKASLVYKKPVGNLSYGQKTLLHELAHAFDGQKLSLSADYMHLTGWVAIQTQNHRLPTYQNSSVSSHEIAKLELECKNIMRGNGTFMDRYNQTEVMQENFARAHGFPSYYALTGVEETPETLPVEHFAEMAAFIFADPSVNGYVSPEIVSWFKKNVLN